MSKKLLFSITAKDCELQTFTVSGPGGGGKDTSNTGVRWIHHPSGARGESRDERSQLANKRLAWERMGRSPKMKAWILKQIIKWEDIETQVDKAMEEVNLKVEVKNGNGKWVMEKDHVVQ